MVDLTSSTAGDFYDVIENDQRYQNAKWVLLVQPELWRLASAATEYTASLTLRTHIIDYKAGGARRTRLRLLINQETKARAFVITTHPASRETRPQPIYLFRGTWVIVQRSVLLRCPVSSSARRSEHLPAARQWRATWVDANARDRATSPIN